MAASVKAYGCGMTARDDLENAFLVAHGWADAQRHSIAGDASFRRYKRLTKADGASTILMDAAPPREDVRPFMAITRHLTAHGFSAPQLLAHDVENGFLLLEDLGDDRYSRAIAANADLEDPLYAAAVDTLAAMHALDLPQRLPVTDSITYDVPEYDEALYLRETALFTDWYMPAILGGPVSSEDRREFQALWAKVTNLTAQAKPVLVLRDYHADNLMWLPSRQGIAQVGLLDYQDAVRGHPAYDLVSLLEDARRDVPPVLAERMLARYIAATGATPDTFRCDYAILGAQRNTKIIGIFSRLYARDGKTVYLDLIPRVWGLLERDLAHPALKDIKAWFDARIPAAVRRVPPQTSALKPLPKYAMVLAAGLGQRMRPLTNTTPKPLIKVAGRPMLDRILDHLAAAGVDHVVVNAHHLADQVMEHIAARNGQLPAVTLSDERDLLLDSGGGVVKALPQLGGKPFFVLNGDMLYADGGAMALVRLAAAWNPVVMDALLLVIPAAHAVGHDGPGDFFMDDDGRLTRRGTAPSAPYVFMGVQILNPALFDGFKAEPFSLNKIYDKALARGRLYGLVHDGFWAHVGTPDAIAQAEAAWANLSAAP